jgi:hypothetical protein
MPKVTCPCCHGKKKILVFERDHPTGNVPEDMVFVAVSHVECSHCEGTGEIEAEAEENGSSL